MRALTLVVAATLAGAAGLAGQHAHEYEFGVFGAYTQYDAAFNLADKVGGGVRLGYLFSNLLEAEVDVVLQPEYTVGANARIEPLIGGASLVLNVLHGAGNSLYLLGGYSRLDFGSANPYQFTDGGVHGAIGDRLFLTHRLALRVEGRAIYTPDTKAAFVTKSVTHLVGTVGLAIFASSGKHAAPPAPAPAPPPPPPPPAPAAPAPAPTPMQDADQDGVPDAMDACPNTPIGTKVDARGCPLDSDGDGVPDGVDQCPETPAGAMVDAKGCPIDSDGDHVPDGIDQCPNTPAGAVVDAKGCPVDSDGDGVPDGLDKCPDTPSGTTVDAVGCPVQAAAESTARVAPPPPPVPPPPAPAARKCPPAPPRGPVDANGGMLLFAPQAAPPAAPGAAPPPPAPPGVILGGVTFATARSTLTPESDATLDAVAAALLADPDIRVEIAGYTDNLGPIGTNLRLSRARAAAVRAYLAKKGVSLSRMVIRGYGSRHPIAPNTTAAGRAQNRRVELHKLP